MMNRVRLLYGDITKYQVEAIVNAANSSLLGGGGVDGAIHRIGGNRILEECQKIRNRQGGCKTGDSVITTAGNLPADYVIHTVGPYWSGGENNEPELLKAAYCSCLKLVDEYQIETISFPNISTGIYKYPKQLAAEIALKAIYNYLNHNDKIKLINFVCFDKENYEIYSKMMNEQSNF